MISLSRHWFARLGRILLILLGLNATLYIATSRSFAAEATAEGSGAHRAVPRHPDPLRPLTITRRATNDGLPSQPDFIPPTGSGLAATSTVLTMHGEPGDYIGAGNDYRFTPTDGSFTISGSSSQVSIAFNNGAHFWYLDFNAPHGAPLTVGTYTGATRYPFNSFNEPGLSVYGDGRGCNTLTGSFRIKQISLNASQQVTAFWATFEQHCEGGIPALTGEIRFNATVDVVISAPLSKRVTFGHALNFEVTAETGDSSHVTLTAAGLPAGAAFTDNGNNTGTFSWLPGFDRIGSHAPVTFRAVNPHGAADSVTTDILVEGITSLAMRGDPGDYISGGQTYFYTPDDGRFGAFASNRNHVSIVFSGQSHSWYVDLQAPNGAVLAVGTYTGATRYPFNSGNVPGLSVDGDGRGCNQLTGSFQVKQIAFNTDGSLLALRASFEQHCEGGTSALTGEVRYNASVAVDLRAPATQSVTVGRPLAFDVTAASYDSTHVTLTASNLPSGGTFTDNGNNSGTFRWTPAFSQINTSALVTFRGTNAGGAGDSAQTRVNATGITFLQMTSEPGDYIGNGQSYAYTPSNGTFQISGSRNHVSVSFTSTNDSWTLDFAAPGTSPLAVGEYLGATSYRSYETANTPRMNIARSYNYCSQVIGSFVIKQIEFDSHGVPYAFRATFEQRCGTTTAALTGEVRYSANLRLDVVAPGSRAASLGGPLHFDVIGESFDGNPVTLSADSLPAGATFIDRGNGLGAFDWTPGIGQVGTYRVRFQARNALGASDSTTTRIDVTGATSLSITSDPQDYVGQGQSYFYLPTNGTFRIEKNQLGGVSVGFRDSLSYYEGWSLDFSSPKALPLEVNVYDNAGSYPNQPLSLPGLSVRHSGYGCYQLDGQFVVRQVVYGSGNDIISFWATFAQTCQGAGGGLHGEIRYNADVQLIVTAPQVLIVSEGTHATINVAALTQPGIVAELVAPSLPAGATFVDHRDNTATFDWVPGYNQRGSYWVSFVAFASLGAIDSARTRVIVKNVDRAPIAHAGGPYRVMLGDSLTFDGSGSFDPDSESVSLFWDFGDGSHGFGPRPQHRYSGAGRFTAVLSVTDGLLFGYDSTTVDVGSFPPSPRIAGFSPRQGPVGTPVQITGSGLSGTTRVTFNGTAATYTFVTDSLVRATVPDGATTGLIQLTTANGVATSRDSFVVLPPPPPPASCPHTAKYWRTHVLQWPVRHLLLGAHEYAAGQLVSLLGHKHANAKTSPSQALARELIAAKFNILSGASIPRAVVLAAEADSAIGDQLILFPKPKGHSERDALEQLILGLRSYNAGLYSPGCKSANIPTLAQDGDLDDEDAALPMVEFYTVRPNPFRSSTHLAMGLSRDKSVRVSVIDLQGREVRRIYDGPLAAGEHDFVWNGADEGSHPLESGVYFYRIITDGAITIRKVVRMK